MGCSQGKTDKPTAPDDLHARMRHAEKQRGVVLPGPGDHHPHHRPAHGPRKNYRPEGGERKYPPRPQREATPAPLTPMRKVREYEANPKPSGPMVIARHGNTWYGAHIIKDTSDGKVDVCWDDGSYTIGIDKEHVYPIAIGTAVDCKWGSDWYPATIKQLGASLDVTWSDGSHSVNLSPTSLRPQTYFPEEDPTTPTNAGVFGRRAVLMPGDEVEVHQDGYWQPAIIHHVGDLCTVEMRGATHQVPLSVVRSPESGPFVNKDLAG
eukprot:TRINITY_DN13475_c0_g1_i1.p1 TRINITY_DN13475_c0_g1~~TRINITY_DN13475_c0_g1_i1.p1  ORF type:complete len:265 (+),score=52.66 TRINITY_DN13475_c0_g1_i1:43-837(+)